MEMISLTLAQQLKNAVDTNAANCFLNYPPGMVFGTDDPQKEHIGALKYVLKRKADKKAIIASDLQQATDLNSEAKKAYEHVSNYWLESIRWGQSITDFSASKNTGPEIEDRINRLLSVYGDDETALQDHSAITPDRFDAHKKYQIRSNTDGKIRPMGESTLKYDMKVRRACKFLIYDSIELGLKIHYILDGITSASVADRMMFSVGEKNNNINEKVPICTSEIREIFRHWRSLKNHIVWFRQFRASVPLWQEPGPGLKSWATYAVSLLEKRRASGQTVVPSSKQLTDKLAAGAYAQIIVYYHGLDDTLLKPEYLNAVTAY
jgi:hypothetical protein